MFYTSLLPQQFDLKSRVGECLLLPLAAHSLSTKKLETFRNFHLHVSNKGRSRIWKQSFKSRFQGFWGIQVFLFRSVYFVPTLTSTEKNKQTNKQKTGKISPFCPQGPTPTPVKCDDFPARFQSKSNKRSVCAGSRVVRYFRMIQKYQFIIASFDMAMKPSKMA